MLKVALTGGIGSGKTLVGDYLQELGAVVIDSDELARNVIERGTAGFEQVVSTFGDEILSNGEIDRTKLAQQVFENEEKRKKLESIIHPLVRQAAELAIKDLAPDQIVVNEIPLLFETQGAKRFDFVITVETSMEIRITRLKERGMKDYEISKRISAQASDEQRASIADVVLKNDGSPEELRKIVERLWFEELVPRSRKI